MPIEPDPQTVSAWPNQVNIPAAAPGFFLSIQLQTDGTPTTEAQDTLLQDLIDYLQEWPGKLPGANVTGQKYDTKLYVVSPTNPEPLPDPPGEDPNGLLADEESPSSVV